MDAAGNAPHATVIAPGAVIVGNGAGSTVIVLDTEQSLFRKHLLQSMFL